MTTWFDSGTPPTESGYYLTIHDCKSQGCHLFKAFWYDVIKAEWKFRYAPDVKLYWNKKFDFYAPCQLQDGVDLLPEPFQSIMIQEAEKTIP